MRLSTELASVVAMVANQNGLDPCLVAAIVRQESGGNTWATRFEPAWRYYADPKSGAPVTRDLVRGLGTCSDDTERICQQTSFGPMQVMGAVAREHGFSPDFLVELLDPILGITYGTRHLKRFCQKYELEDAIACYNGGPGCLVATDPKIVEGRDRYVSNVIGFMRGFAKDGI